MHVSAHQIVSCRKFVFGSGRVHEFFLYKSACRIYFFQITHPPSEVKWSTPNIRKLFSISSKGSVKVDFEIVIILVTNNPKNATTIADKKAEAAQRVVVRAKKGAVERLRVKAVIVKSK